MSGGRLASALLLVKQLTPVASRSTRAATSSGIDLLAVPLLDAAQLVAGRNLRTQLSFRGVHSAPKTRYEPHPFAQAGQDPLPFSPAFPDLAVAAGPVVGPAAAVAQTDDDPAREADKSHTNNIVDIPNHMFDNIKRLGREGKLPELVQLFKQNQLLQATHPLNVALQNLQKHLVSQFYYAMVDTLGIPPNASSAALHIRALGQLQKLSQAEAFWKQWQARGNPVDPVTLGALAGAYGTSGMPEAIESLIEVAKAASLPPVMSAYTSLIKAWGLRKSLVNVRRVLIEMVEDGVQPNQLHYRTAIVAHGQNLRPNEAQYLIGEMKKAGMAPDVLTYGSMITAFANVRRPRRAAGVMQDFIDEGGQPTLVMCNQLTNAWSKTGETGEIRAVMANMRNLRMRPDVYTWTSLVHAHAVSGQTGKAAEVLREMADSGVAPGVVSYTSLLNAYGQAGDLAAAHQLLREMQAGGVHPNHFTYTSLMGYYSQRGDVAKVQGLQDEMVAQGIEVDAISHLLTVEAAMEAWYKAGRSATALVQADQLFRDSPVMKLQPIFKDESDRGWRSVFIELHGYGHWSCQLALLAGLRSLYYKSRKPDWQWPSADLVVVVGKGNNSAYRHNGHVRDAVLHFLQHLVPVKLAANNDGLVSVRRGDMLKFFDRLRHQQPEFDAARFTVCFEARPQEFNGVQHRVSAL